MGRLLRVGLTGGIGSGKSTVARLLGLLGAAVYLADDRAKTLMTQDAALRQGIVELLGSGAFSADGTMLERAYIASRVFGDAERLAALNALVHPAVERDFVAWAATQKNVLPRPTYLVEEAAVLIESGAWRRVDCVVAVEAPERVRLERVMRRDGVSQAAAKARIAAQLSDGERAKYADFVLTANDLRLLVPQVVRLHGALCGRGERIQDFLPTFASTICCF